MKSRDIVKNGFAKTAKRAIISKKIFNFCINIDIILKG